MRALVYCGGFGRRWDGPGVKQRVEVDGEVLIHRTLRQLRERDVNAIMVQRSATGTSCPPYADCAAYAWHTLIGNEHPTWCEGVMATADLWRGPTAALLGDVYFEDGALDAILEPDGLHVYGRQHGSPITGKPCGEVFAASWDDDSKTRWLEALQAGAAHAQALAPADRDESGSPLGSPWQAYRHLAGIPLGQHRCDAAVWRELGGWTEDFDCMADWVTWTQRRQAARVTW